MTCDDDAATVAEIVHVFLSCSVAIGATCRSEHVARLAPAQGALPEVW